ncbi:MAG TPA: hypothetical protein EYP20_06250 [Aigarchaeota archaeon]|nr:hypothetical protein [Aigarchaeota archaeon]
MRREEESIINSLRRIESYRGVFERYCDYEHRVMPGLVTAFGECVEEVQQLPAKNVFMVGVPEEFFQELYGGFTGDAGVYLLDPLVGENYDLWVVAVPSEARRRVTWVVFPVTTEDMAEIRRTPVFSVALVPVKEKLVSELSDKVSELIEGLGRGCDTPSEKGIILVVDLSTP